MNSAFVKIAIDGGAGTGKSTTSRLLSKRLSLLHVDTGSHYRSLTKYFLNRKIKPKDLVEYLNINKVPFSSRVLDGKSSLLIDGIEADLRDLRSEEVNSHVSHYASQQIVRDMLFSYQRSQVDLARENGFSGVVMEGRDIGTVILPEADLKVFLSAQEKVREQRRTDDGEIDQILSRDFKDSNRSSAPLMESAGCLRIDTTYVNAEEVYSTIRNALPLP